jgi:hypothetical protein
MRLKVRPRPENVRKVMEVLATKPASRDELEDLTGISRTPLYYCLVELEKAKKVSRHVARKVSHGESGVPGGAMRSVTVEFESGGQTNVIPVLLKDRNVSKNGNYGRLPVVWTVSGKSDNVRGVTCARDATTS